MISRRGSAGSGLHRIPNFEFRILPNPPSKPPRSRNSPAPCSGSRNGFRSPLGPQGNASSLPTLRGRDLRPAGRFRGPTPPTSKIILYPGMGLAAKRRKKRKIKDMHQFRAGSHTHPQGEHQACVPSDITPYFCDSCAFLRLFPLRLLGSFLRRNPDATRSHFRLDRLDSQDCGAAIPCPKSHPQNTPTRQKPDSLHPKSKIQHPTSCPQGAIKRCNVLRSLRSDSFQFAS